MLRLIESLFKTIAIIIYGILSLWGIVMAIFAVYILKYVVHALGIPLAEPQIAVGLLLLFAFYQKISYNTSNRKEGK